MAYITNKTTTASGNNISLNNMINYNIQNLQLLGDTNQTGTPSPSSPVNIDTVTGQQDIVVCGKNLLNIPDNTYSTTEVTAVAENGEITINGTTTATRFINIPVIINVNGTYTLSANNSVANSNVIIRFDSGYLSLTCTNANASIYNTYSNIKFTQFTIRIASGQTINNFKIKPQLEVGNQATTYEPYKNKIYGINLGKNLFDKSTIQSVINGTNNDGLITSDTWSSGSWVGTTITFTPIKITKEFTISMEIRLTDGSTGTFSKLNDGVQNITEVAKPTLSNQWQKYVYKYTPSSSYSINKFFIQLISITGEIQIRNMQIEYGSTASEYAPYFTPIELCEIEDYQDKIKKSTGINLFNKSAITSGKLIQVDGTEVANTSYGASDYIKVTANTQYVRTSCNNYYGAFYDNNKNFVEAIQNQNVITPSVDGYVRISFLLTNIDSVQFQKGTSVTIYEPYGEVWYLHKEIGKVDLSTLSWTANSHNTSGYKRYTTTGVSNIKYVSANTQLGDALATKYKIHTGRGMSGADAIDCFAIDTSMVQAVDLEGSTPTGLMYYALLTPTNTIITNETLINELEQASKLKLYDGTNNVISNGNLGSVLSFLAYTNENPYVDILYGGDSQNKARIWFNDVEMLDFGTKCEKITKTARIMPNDGNKVFTLSNFVSTELEIILHDVDVEDLVDQVKLSIGTITESSSLGDTYEWIPLGIFNIQNQPVVNDNKVTLKLRDNRVKFDFNYNGQTLIESLGGIATKRQILEDICSQAGVTHEIDNFKFENDAIGVYDDTITATKYISYLADQCGCTPTINRDGHLIFIDYNNLFTWRIPKSILPSPFEVGTPFEIQRVVYESGIIKYESSNDDTLETLYLDTNNMYIDRQTQIDYIYNLLNGFVLDSVTTQKMLGNPAIDPYDFIEIYDDSDVNETIIAKTLANNTYVFNGKHSNIFQTAIGKEQRKENVSIKGQSSFERWAKTKIDNIEGTVEIQTGKVETLENNQELQYTELTNKFNNYATLENVETITTQVTQLQTDTYTKTQIQQIANGTGVDGVKVTAVISTEAQFDENGMHYSKTNAPTTSTINYKGLEVDDSNNNELLFAGYDEDDQSLTYGTSIVRSDNLNVKTYLQVGNNKGRFEQYTDDDGNTGVGFFLT